MNNPIQPSVLSAESTKMYLGGKTLRDYPSISGYLENFDSGRDPTPPSDFYDNLGLGREGVLDTTLKHVNSWSDIPRLKEYELTRVAKYGPQGWIYPLGSDDQIAKIAAYYSFCDRPCHVSKAAMSKWFKAMEGELLTPYTPEEVIARQLEKTGLTSNCGIMHTDAFKRRKDVISKGIAESTEIRTAEDVLKYCSVVGARCIKQKERLIFMQPMPLNIAELQYVYALMDAMLLRVPWVLGWTNQPSVETGINDQMCEDELTYLSSDYTAMDTRCGADQHRTYLEAVLPLFKPQYRERYKQIVSAKANMPVMVGALKSPGRAPTGPGDSGARKSYTPVILTGQHGKTSGEGDTNCEETVLGILNKLSMEDYGLVSVAFQQDGDDGIQAFDRTRKDVAEIFAKASGKMGLDANPEKQLVSDDEFHYLQRVYSPETVQNGYVLGAYPMVLMVNSLKNPERFTNLSVPERALRKIEIAENCYHHPKFEEIARYVVAGDPTLQSWTHLAASEWRDLSQTHAAMLKRNPFASHGHAQSGLESYAFVDLLRSGKL